MRIFKGNMKFITIAILELLIIVTLIVYMENDTVVGNNDCQEIYKSNVHIYNDYKINISAEKKYKNKTLELFLNYTCSSSDKGNKEVPVSLFKNEYNKDIQIETKWYDEYFCINLHNNTDYNLNYFFAYEEILKEGANLEKYFSRLDDMINNKWKEDGYIGG